MHHPLYKSLHAELRLDNGSGLQEYPFPDEPSHKDPTSEWYVELRPEQSFAVKVSCDPSQLPSSVLSNHAADGVGKEGHLLNFERTLLLLIEADGYRLYYGRPSHDSLTRRWECTVNTITDEHGNRRTLKFGSVQVDDGERPEDGDLPKSLGQIEISLMAATLQRLPSDTEHDQSVARLVDRARIPERAVKGRAVTNLVRPGARVEPGPTKKTKDVVDIIRSDVIARFRIRYRTRQQLEQEGVCTGEDMRDAPCGNKPDNPIILD